MEPGLHVIPVYRALTIVNSALQRDGAGGLVLAPVMTSTLSYPVEVRYELHTFTDAPVLAAVAHLADVEMLDQG